MNTRSRRTLPCPSLYSSIVHFHFTSEDNVSMTEWHQDLCPNGLVSLDRQDLDKALTGTAIAARSPLHICRSSSKCSSEPNSFVGCEINRKGQVTESRGGEVWMRMVGEVSGKMWRMYWWNALQEECRTIPLLGTPCCLSPALFYLLALLCWPVKTWNGYQIDKQKLCYWAHVTTHELTLPT